MVITRRGLITGLASLLAAPAIVRASSLMPVKMLPTGALFGALDLAGDRDCVASVVFGQVNGQWQILDLKNLEVGADGLLHGINDGAGWAYEPPPTLARTA